MKNEIATIGLFIGLIAIFAHGSFKNVSEYSVPENVDETVLDIGNVPLQAESVKKFFFLVEEGENCSITFLANSSVSLFAVSFDADLSQENELLANLTVWKKEDATSGSGIFQVTKTGILALLVRNDASEDSLVKNLRFSLIQRKDATKISIRQNDIPLLIGALITLASISLLLLPSKNITRFINNYKAARG